MSHVTVLNILRSKQIVRHAASGMECRGTCTIFLMQRIPYFSSQSWPWCLQKECCARWSRETILEAGLPKRIPGGYKYTWSHSPFFLEPLSLGSARAYTLSPIQTTSMKEIIMVVASKTTFVMEDADLNSVQSALIKTFFIQLLY